MLIMIHYGHLSKKIQIFNQIAQIDQNTNNIVIIKLQPDLGQHILNINLINFYTFWQLIKYFYFKVIIYGAIKS